MVVILEKPQLLHSSYSPQWAARGVAALGARLNPGWAPGYSSSWGGKAYPAGAEFAQSYSAAPPAPPHSPEKKRLILPAPRECEASRSKLQIKLKAPVVIDGPKEEAPSSRPALVTLPETSKAPLENEPLVVEIHVQGIDYHKLVQDADLKSVFEAAIKDSVANSVGVEKETVAVELDVGSAIAKATLEPPPHPQAASSLQALQLSEMVQKELVNLPRINTCATGATGDIAVTSTCKARSDGSGGSGAGHDHARGRNAAGPAPVGQLARKSGSSDGGKSTGSRRSKGWKVRSVSAADTVASAADQERRDHVGAAASQAHAASPAAMSSTAGGAADIGSHTGAPLPFPQVQATDGEGGGGGGGSTATSGGHCGPGGGGGGGNANGSQAPPDESQKHVQAKETLPELALVPPEDRVQATPPPEVDGGCSEQQASQEVSQKRPEEEEDGT